MPNLVAALYLANTIHAEQKRWNGDPYVLHPIRVMLQMKVEKRGEAAMVVALLHDVVEDSKYNPEFMLATIEDEHGKEVSDAVYAITKQDGEAYMDYIERVRQNPLARVVKIADINDNLMECPAPCRNATKYLTALQALQEWSVADDQTVKA